MAKSRTLRNRYLDALLVRGFKIAEKQKSKKCTTLEHAEIEKHPFKYFIGKAGSVRTGRTYSKSFALLDSTKKALLKEIPK